MVAVAWIVALGVVGTGLSFAVLRLLPEPAGPSARFAWRAGVWASGFVVSSAVVGIRFAGLTWQEAGWRRPGSRFGWLALGAGVGMLLSGVALGVALPVSGATLRAGGSAAVAGVGLLVVALFAAALFEELVFRGAPLALLARGVGRWPATLVAAVGFGVAHLRNPNASALSSVNIALAALLLSVAFWSRGGMPLAWGLHFGWNAGLGLVFGAPVSGIAFGAAPLAYRAGLRAWVDGGAFGPEGGLAATLAMTVGVALLVGRRLFEPRLWLA